MSAIIDGVIILLLAGSITYGYLVSRKVRLLMATLKDLEPLVEEFSYAVDKSQNSVAQLRRNIDAAEPPAAPQPAADLQATRPETAFEARHRTQEGQVGLGMRVMRDKQDMVRAFFDNADAAQA